MKIVKYKRGIIRCEDTMKGKENPCGNEATHEFEDVPMCADCLISHLVITIKGLESMMVGGKDERAGQ